MPRKMVSRSKKLDIYSLEGSFSAAIDYLQRLREKYGDEASLYIDCCSGDSILGVAYKCEETEKEQEKRLATTRKEKGKREKNERTQLKKLLKKYGGK